MIITSKENHTTFEEIKVGYSVPLLKSLLVNKEAAINFVLDYICDTDISSTVNITPIDALNWSGFSLQIYLVSFPQILIGPKSSGSVR